MVAPALLCGSLIGSLPVVTVVAFFAATVFKNTQHAEPLLATPHSAVQLQHPSMAEAAPFLLFLLLLGLELFLKVTHDRQAATLAREREEALQDAHQCREAAKPLEAPDTYAQAAKLQRRALMREKHAAQLASLKAKHGNALEYRAVRLARSAAAIAFVVWAWGRHPAAVEPRLLWPMDGALSLVPGKPAAAAAAISAPTWAWVCLAASSRVAGLLQRAIPSRSVV